MNSETSFQAGDLPTASTGSSKTGAVRASDSLAKFRRMVVLICRLLLATLFAFAAIEKASNGTQPGRTIVARLIPSRPGIIALAVGEFGFAFWLASGICRRQAAAVVMITIVSFSGLLAAELTKAKPAPCGCMGGRPSTLGTERSDLVFALGRNVVALGMATTIYISQEAPRRG